MKKLKLQESIIWTLDSYKDLHSDMLPDGTENVFSYLEAREGAEYDYNIVFGMQPILEEWLDGEVVTTEKIDEIEPIMHEHFKYNGKVWHRAKWDYIVKNHGGKLPVRIRMVKEGTKIPISNALFTIEATDKNCAWLSNALETLLQQVWYPTTVCTRSHFIVNLIRRYFEWTVDDDQQWLIDYYLHDFGQRGCKCMEQAGIGGAAHLVNSKGTDTKMGMKFAINYYDADYKSLAYSVAASEHAIATALGKEKEFEVTKNLIKKFPTGILSVVSDSYSIENAIKVYCHELKNDILARDGKFVVRPDSPRHKGDTPEAQVLWIAERLWDGFGGTINSKGYKVLDSHVGIIYGDGIDQNDMHNILETLRFHGFAASTCVFGCGSYLLDRLYRDTERFAVKASAININGVWYDQYKQPQDITKRSKRGRLALVNYNKNEWTTLTTDLLSGRKNELEIVFENGEIKRRQTFEEIRALANPVKKQELVEV